MEIQMDPVILDRVGNGICRDKHPEAGDS
jgi:hypothetical protein